MKKLLVLIFATLLATGCSSIPQQSFNSEANKNIKTVALLEPPAIKKVKVSMLHHPAASFGLVGAAIALADTTAKTTDYDSSIKGSKMDWTSYIQQTLKSDLEKNGYTVKTVKARKKGDTKREFMEQYPDTGTDAILDYYYAVQHTATGPTTDYIPTVIVFSRMVKSSDKSVIYAQHFTSGNPALAKKGAVVSPGNVGYKNIATLKAKSSESMQALKESAVEISGLIAKDLKK